MYYNNSYSKPSSGYSTVFFVLLTAVAIVAGAVIVLEAMKLQKIHATAGGTTTAYTFALMLASLSGVLLSVVLPERVGKAMLLIGALGFFACLAVALTTNLRF